MEARNAATTTIAVPVTVDATQANFPGNAPIYMYIVGLVKTDTTKTFYRLDSGGIPRAMTTSDNTNAAWTFPDSGKLDSAAAAIIAQNYPLAWADYSIPVSQTAATVIDLANINPTNCPGLGTGTAAFSGRVYISIGIPRLPISPITDGYTAPVPIGFPGQYTLFDWIEFSYDSAGNFNGNTTQVDQFGFPLTLNGTPGGSIQGVLNQTRATIMSEFGATLTGPIGGGVLQVAVPAGTEAAYPAGTAFLRVMSPKTLTAPASYTGSLLSFFDAVITSSYKTWETTPLVTNDQETGFYTGVVPTTGDDAGVLVFYKGNFPTLAQIPTTAPDFKFTNKIQTSDVWQCANTLATGDKAELNVGKILAAAFNRGFFTNPLSDVGCDANAPQFYPSGATFNQWSQMFHGFSTNKLSYAFPYDDVCNQNPSISLTGAKSVTIVIGSFQ